MIWLLLAMLFVLLFGIEHLSQKMNFIIRSLHPDGDKETEFRTDPPMYPHDTN